jgi:UDP-N-acetylmuramoyl-tripeptide--D-alanyl-D-alanine ligase
MKTILRTTVVFLITFLAKIVVSKYKPRIIVVSGSVGKTSTKDALKAVLEETYFLRASEKSYNSDTGVPLTILGCKNPWNDYWGWLSVIWEGILLSLLPNHYPQLLILEVGADKPGDIREMITWLFPDVVVITKLPEIPVHVEAYSSPHETREEEFSPAYVLKPDGILVYNQEDQYAHELSKEVSAKTYTFGTQEHASIIASHISHTISENAPTGIHGSLSYQGETVPFTLPGVFGTHHAYPVAAAVLVGILEGIPFAKAVGSLNSYEPPKGRGRIIPGKKGMVLIDDTYNSSPVAVSAALSALQTFSKERKKVVILGDMLELGTYAAREHEAVGKMCTNTADILVTVGIRARGILEGAKKGGMKKEQLFSYRDSHEAREDIETHIPENALVLIKGSQSIRMERIVKQLLRDDVVPSDILPRQDKEWLRKG